MLKISLDIFLIGWLIVSISIFFIFQNLEEKKYCKTHNIKSLDELNFFKRYNIRKSLSLKPTLFWFGASVLLLPTLASSSIFIKISSYSTLSGILFYILWCLLVIYFSNFIYPKISSR